MSVLVDLFWPAFALGLLIGAVASTMMFRRRLRGAMKARFVAGALTIVSAFALLWIGPAGAGDRFAARVDRLARVTLDYYEMPGIDAHLERGPLRRNLLLNGEADEFQTAELVRLFSQLPGVNRAEFAPSFSLPLWIEAVLVGIAGYLIGLGLAYLLELHRRYNAQWNW